MILALVLSPVNAGLFVGVPIPPPGFQLLKGADGAYLKGADGAYLYGRAA